MLVEDVRARVEAFLGTTMGLIHSPFPGIYFFRTTDPVGPKRSFSKMVTLAVVLRGRKSVDFGDGELVYEPGRYLFITGEQQYSSRVEGVSETHPYLSMALEFPPEEVAEALLELMDAGLEPPPTAGERAAVVDSLAPPMFDALGRLVKAMGDPVSRAVLAPLARRELLIHLLRSEAGGGILRRAAAGDDGRIRKAMTYIEANLSERISVEEVARHVAMSSSHFAHRFREVARMAPMQYAKHLRMKQARLLMLEQQLSASEAANAVGYASPSHFTRDFKAYFGSPPAAFVARLRVG